jgi:hypothetical protein
VSIRGPCVDDATLRRRARHHAPPHGHKVMRTSRSQLVHVRLILAIISAAAAATHARPGMVAHRRTTRSSVGSRSGQAKPRPAASASCGVGTRAAPPQPPPRSKAPAPTPSPMPPLAGPTPRPASCHVAAAFEQQPTSKPRRCRQAACVSCSVAIQGRLHIRRIH